MAAAAVAQRARDAQAAAVARSSSKYGLLMDEESEEEEAAQLPAPTTAALPPRPPKGKKLRASKVRVLCTRGVRLCRLLFSALPLNKGERLCVSKVRSRA